MIIECINCGKKFDVNSDLIPSEGRTIQCGSCNHTWFYKKNNTLSLSLSKSQIKKKPAKIDDKIQPIKKSIGEEKKETIIQDTINKSSNIKGSEIVEYKSKSHFTFSNFLSYILVIMISFVGLIILIDTFKFQLYEVYPKLEFLLYSFYETLKDIQLFIKDLT